MDVEGFKRTGEDLFGNGWQSRLARALGVDASSVRRWVGSTIPVPPAVTAFLRAVTERQEARGALAYEQLRLGRPVSVLTPGPTVLAWMEQRFVFAGVDQAKPMPAIASRRDGAGIHASLDGAPGDRIGETDLSYALVRHPDPVHTAAFVAAAAADGRVCTTVSHRFHHYTLIVHDDAVPQVLRRIHTHAGTIRTLTAETTSPSSVSDA